MEHRKEAKDKMKKNKIIVAGLGVFLLVFLLISVRFFSVTRYTESLSKNWSYFFTAEKNLPLYSKTLSEVDDISEDKIQMYVFYKVGCPYCDAAHPVIKKKIESLPRELQKEVHYVNTESPAGQYLIYKYGVKKAATIVIDDKTGNKVQKFAEASKIKGKFSPNQSSIQSAFEQLQTLNH